MSRADYAVRIKNHWLIVLATLLVAFSPLFSFAQTERDNADRLPRVLYINSYHPGYPWSDSLATGIFETLKGKVLLYTEYLDAKRPDFEEYKAILPPVFALKYGNVPLDAILTSDDAAFELVSKNRDTLFKGVPVVTCGINYMTPEILAKCPGSTGVMEGGHPLQTAQLALKLFPEARQMVFITEYVTGEGPLKQIELIRSSIPGIKYVNIRQSEDTTAEEVIAELQKTVATAPSVVFFFGLTSKDFRMNLESDSMKRLASVGAPVFVLSRRFVDYGALGGIIQDGNTQGAMAAQMVLKVINGSPAEEIPPVYKTIDRKIFNYESMKHFGLIGNPLLADALIIGGPDSRLVRYRQYLFGGLIFIGLQAVLITGLVKSNRDRRRSAIKLQQSEEHSKMNEQRYRFLSNAAQEAVLLCQGGTIIEANQRFFQLIDKTKEDLQKGLLLEHLMDPAALRAGETVTIDLRNDTDPTGKAIIAEVSLMQHEFHDELVDVLVIRDISAQKETEEMLILAKMRAEAANRAKSDFLTTMSHELRTPMNGIMGMTQLMQDTELSEDQREYTNVIHSSSKSLLKIINDLLDLAGIEHGKVTLCKDPFDLRETALQVIELLTPQAREKEIELAFTYEPNLPREFMGDEVRIRQILFNLMGNAIKFTDSGWARLAISSEAVPDEGMLIRIEVSETGIGIPQDKLDIIFEKFTQVDQSDTRRYEGTGLGLNITHRLVELMGGSISCESIINQGSTFTVILPLPVLAAETATEKLHHSPRLARPL